MIDVDWDAVRASAWNIHDEAENLLWGDRVYVQGQMEVIRRAVINRAARERVVELIEEAQRGVGDITRCLVTRLKVDQMLCELRELVETEQERRERRQLAHR